MIEYPEEEWDMLGHLNWFVKGAARHDARDLAKHTLDLMHVFQETRTKARCNYLTVYERMRELLMDTDIRWDENGNPQVGMVVEEAKKKKLTVVCAAVNRIFGEAEYLIKVAAGIGQEVYAGILLDDFLSYLNEMGDLTPEEQARFDQIATYQIAMYKAKQAVHAAHEGEMT